MLSACRGIPYVLISNRDASERGRPGKLW
jgi:hypothetical protein